MRSSASRLPARRSSRSSVILVEESFNPRGGDSSAGAGFLMADIDRLRHEAPGGAEFRLRRLGRLADKYVWMLPRSLRMMSGTRWRGNCAPVRNVFAFQGTICQQKRKNGREKRAPTSIWNTSKRKRAMNPDIERTR